MKLLLLILVLCSGCITENPGEGELDPDPPDYSCRNYCLNYEDPTWDVDQYILNCVRPRTCMIRFCPQTGDFNHLLCHPEQ